MTVAFQYVQVLSAGGSPAPSPEQWVPLVVPAFANDPQDIDPTVVKSVPGLAYVNIGTDNVGANIQIEQMRGASKFPNPQRVTAAGVTGLWSPPANNRLRLMAFTISVCAAIASGPNVLEVTLLQDATPIWMGNAFCDATITGHTQMGADFGQGHLLAAAADLNLNLSEACTAGSVAVTVWGTQELVV